MMRALPFQIARLSALAATIAAAAAIGLARMTPPRSRRVPDPAGPVLFVAGDLRLGAIGSLRLDRDTGRATPLELTGGGELSCASVSPWCDERGRRQAVGVLSHCNAGGDGECGDLVRVGLPDGKVLDLVPLSVPLKAPSCWYPGTSARILFAAGDAWLYCHDFEAAGDVIGTGRTRASGGPRPISWRSPPPGGKPWLSTPHWPSDPRFERTVLVGLARPGSAEAPQDIPRAGLWWLLLSEDGFEVVDAGPLIDSASLPKPLEASTPAVGPAPGGGLVLAYLVGSGRSDWQLRAVPLAVDVDGRPRCDPGAGLVLAEGCMRRFPPTFSADGRWVYIVSAEGDGPPSLRRVAVPQAWPSVGSSPSPDSRLGYRSP